MIYLIFSNFAYDKKLSLKIKFGLKVGTAPNENLADKGHACFCRFTETCTVNGDIAPP